jgi:hypothetical protein
MKTEKACSLCLVIKPMTAFRVDNSSKDGHQSRCCVCQRAKRKERIDLINSYKDCPCADCGKTYPIDCMELDHIFGTKIANVSAMRDAPISKLIEEINKCDVVCCVCHRIRTKNRREPTKEKRLQAHRDMINQYKSSPCADCSQCFPPVAMDLDHVRGKKVFEISNMGHYPRWKVVEELDKCDVVCANCHRMRTCARIRRDQE